MSRKNKDRLKEGSVMYNKPDGVDYIPFILASLIISGFVLRFYNLDFNSVWMDEAVTALHSSGSFESVWTSMTGTLDYNPPFFFVLEWIVLKAYGISEYSLRIVPAIFGLISIPAMYCTGKEFKDKYVGIISAAIIAFSPFLIYYSQEARPYSMVLFICIILMYFFLKGIRVNDSKTWIYFGITSAVLFYTHFYGIVFVGILGLFAIIKLRGEPKNLLWGALVGIATSIPIIIAAYTLYFQRTSTPVTYGSNGLMLIPDSIIQMFGYIGRGTVSFGESYAILVYLILVFVGLVWFYFKDKEKCALMIWIVGLTFMAGIVLSTRIPMLPRYLIFLMIPVSLTIGSTYQIFSNMFSRKHPEYISAAFILVFFILALPFYSSYYTSATRDDWKTVSKDLSALTNDGDTIIVAPRYSGFALDFYYSKEKDNTTEIGVMSAQELLSTPVRGTVYYVMTGDISAADPSGNLQALIQGNTQIVKQYGNIFIARG